MLLLSMPCHIELFRLLIVLLAPPSGNSPTDKYTASRESGEEPQAAVQNRLENENRPC